MTQSNCTIGSVEIGTGKLALIAGPCMAESLELCVQIAEHLKGICESLKIGYIFKASFDKANRSSAESYRGPGLDIGLAWLATVRDTVGVPVLTDIHLPQEVPATAEVVSCLQIPAFLCRQTDLLIAAGQSRLPVNIKKGQFMAPWDMANAVDKIKSTGNEQILLTERGTFFGYNRLVSDMRSIPQMQVYAPVVFDATHSVQQPGGLGNASGGQREYAPMLALAGLVCGADAVFIETHPEPDKARSDAASQIPLAEMEPFLKKALAFFTLARSEDCAT